MSEYIYESDGEPLANARGEVALARHKIVRCKDCTYSHKDGTLCMIFTSWEPIAGGDEYAEIPAVVEPYGFCKWGEVSE